MSTAPVYSHLTYDIVPGEAVTIDQPDILILEGLNVLQPRDLPRDGRAIPFVSDFFDFSIYIDADEEAVRRWYIERFMSLRETRFRDPQSYFRKYADLSDSAAERDRHRPLGAHQPRQPPREHRADAAARRSDPAQGRESCDCGGRAEKALMRKDLAPRDARDRLIVALDVADLDAARAIVLRIGEGAAFYKIGMQLVFAGGLALIPELTGAGKRVFLDMKLLDIGNTVAHAVESIGKLGVTFTTIHAYPDAMRAAVSARPADGPGLLGVTVLTSMDDADLLAAGYHDGTTALAERARRRRPRRRHGRRRLLAARDRRRAQGLRPRPRHRHAGHPPRRQRRRRPEAHHGSGRGDRRRRRLSCRRTAGDRRRRSGRRRGQDRRARSTRAL